MFDKPRNLPPMPKSRAEHIKRKIYDLSYANLSMAQKLDIYWPPDGNGPFPVILSIHGGAFMMGDKRDLQINPMLMGLERGYAVVGVNYRMSGEAQFPILVHDIKAAIRWIRANAETYLFNPQRIATWGGSAGGYLSLMAGLTAGVADLEDLSLGNPDQPCHVQAVVDWFGPTDFLKMDEQLAEKGLASAEQGAHNDADSPESCLLGCKITEIPELVQKANPETYIHSGAPDFFIQHGDHDDTVPHQQSVNIAAKLAATLGKDHVSIELLKGARHGGPEFDAPQNVIKVLDFLDRRLK